MSDDAFGMIASLTSMPMISTVDLSWLAHGCKSTNLMEKPGPVIHLCDHISDLPIPRAISGPIKSLPFDAEIIRQHLLRFGSNGLDWQQYGRGFINTALHIAHRPIETFGLTVVVSGCAAALYMYLCQQGLPLTFNPNQVERDQSPIDSQMLNLNTSHQNLATLVTDQQDQSQANPYELAATIIDVRQYQIEAEADGSIQGESSNDLTTTPNTISPKARSGAGRRRPITRQHEKVGENNTVEGRVKKRKVGKGADQCPQIVTRATTKLHHLSP